MTAGRGATVDEVSPPDALDALAEAPDSLFVDVRTSAEWTFTGMPDLSGTGHEVVAVEWASFPGMTRNEGFARDLIERAGGRLPARLFFMCRSGGRSMAAARHVAAEAESRGESIHCTNVAGGFEGDLDAEGHRGRVNGWKAAGLPWRQG